MNPYKVLGVSETATQEEIRAAYLALVKKYHPDRYADGPLKEMAGEKLKEINRAYELIGKHGGERGGAERTASYGPERTARSAPYAGPNAAAFARVRSLISHNSLGAACTTRSGTICTGSSISGRAGMKRPAPASGTPMNRSRATANTATPTPRCTAPAPPTPRTAGRRAERCATTARRCFAATAAGARSAAADPRAKMDS